MMAVIEEVSVARVTRERLESKASAIAALVELVEGPPSDEKPRVIHDAAAWVHTALYTYRSAMADNDSDLPRLARIEHDFIAALGALNFDDQKRQLRQALRAIQAFPTEKQH